MSAKTESIDARGLACPEPVVRTRKALEAGKAAMLEVLVDNEAARENVARFASYSGCAVETTEEGDGVWRLRVDTAGYRPKGTAREPLSGTMGSMEKAAGSQDGTATILLASAELGSGNAELGALLMKGLVYALAESDAKPKRIILMNSGVGLAVEGSGLLKDLGRLEAEGVEILACGTCLDYLGLKDKLKVGRVTNMYEIAGHLLAGRVARL